MKKWLSALGSVAALLLVTYTWAWIDSYQVTQRYLAQADASLADGDLMGALKGKERRDPQSGTVVFGGGYQQVLDLWSASSAWPRPQGYYKARTAIDEILAQRLTPADGMELFQAFFGRDNGLLPEVLLRTGALLEQQGDLKGAEEIYQTAVEAFPVRPDIVQQAEARLQGLKTKR